MNRSLFILVGALAVAAAVFAAAYCAGQRTCMMCQPATTDDLAWLRTEFQLSDAEMNRIRQLHEGYLPQCADYCAQIAAKKAELSAALAGATNLTETARARLDELTELRKQCQWQMLQHFVAVSQTMPAAQGQRYLAEMERLTLGFHEQTEATMSGTAGHEHHH